MIRPPMAVNKENKKTDSMPDLAIESVLKINTS
jgi:hypothetical protein